MSGRLLTALEAFVEPLDALLARRLAFHAGRERPAAEAELVGVAAGLCGLWRSQGHACLPLQDLPARLAGRSREGFLPLPPAGELLAALERSPLVLDGRGRLYLWRYFQAEQRLARRLRQLAEAPPLPFDAARALPHFLRFFPGDLAEDRQAQAAAASLVRPLWQICGGPGTGKTTTVAKLLALELLTREAPPAIALAAPTGKAATRLFEALGQQVAALELPEPLLARLPRQAFTLHRLLGYSPRAAGGSFRFRPGHPLGYDLLVVDEASMVDLLLMDSFFAALPEAGRVVLLGDKDQLASVETGSVFGDLSAAALGGGFREATREALAPLLGPLLPPAAPPRLADTAIELVQSWRFAGQPSIGGLARAIREGDAAAALALLATPREDLGLSPPGSGAALLAPLAGHLELYLTAPSPAEALARLTEFRLLAVLRGGPFGVEALNREVERRLLEKGRDTSQRWYRGRPILVRENDYENELWNGDLGVVWEEEGQCWAFFPQPGAAGLRRLPLAKLPVHDTAWALTVHQSQGSELDHVLFVLPAEDHPLLGRELLYTGITRARRRVDLAGAPAVVAAAIARQTRRSSGLLDALLAGPPPGF